MATATYTFSTGVPNIQPAVYAADDIGGSDLNATDEVTNSAGVLSLDLDIGDYVAQWTWEGDTHQTSGDVASPHTLGEVAASSGGSTQNPQFVVLQSGGDATTVSCPDSGNLQAIGPMLGPTGRALNPTSADPGEMPPGWTLVDSGGALSNILVPKGAYHVGVFSQFSIGSLAAGNVRLTNMASGGLGTVGSGLNDVARTDDGAPLVSGWSVTGLLTVAVDGDPLFTDLASPGQVSTTKVDGVELTYLQLEIVRLW